ncbi:MAG: LysE family translocator [Alphaproteobacteria bacterium]|nr:LysE family translocator [Alphaproteobacteria bacterium]
MPSLTTYMAFVAAVLAMQLVPGPETMLVISRGIGEGQRVCFYTVLGMTLIAGIIQLPLLVSGVAAIVAASRLAFELLRCGGAIYLLWLGARLMLSRDAAGVGIGQSVQHERSAVEAMRDGLAANLGNPNPIVFMVAFLPQFIDGGRGSVTMQLLVLGATQKLTGFLVLGSTALICGAMGGLLARRPGWLIWQQRIAGLALVGLALRLLLVGALHAYSFPNTR